MNNPRPGSAEMFLAKNEEDGIEAFGHLIAYFFRNKDEDGTVFQIILDHVGTRVSFPGRRETERLTEEADAIS